MLALLHGSLLSLCTKTGPPISVRELEDFPNVIDQLQAYLKTWHDLGNSQHTFFLCKKARLINVKDEWS